MIVIAECRALPVREVLANSLGPLPWSLAKSDVSLRKTDKAALARNLEKSVSLEETIPQPLACIIDGTSIVHKLKGDGKTFAQLADSAFKLALLEGTGSARIDVVFDVYIETSTKNFERCNRVSATGTQWKKIAPAHRILLWKIFLRMLENKISLPGNPIPSSPVAGAYKCGQTTG